MKRICAWCEKDMGEIPGNSVPFGEISHGICELCFAKIESIYGTPLIDYLDTLSVPVALVDKDGIVVTGNRQLQSLLGKDLSRIEGFRGGNVFECVYSTLPEGCGKTIHCSACTIRNTVMDTYNTGNNHYRRLSYLNQGTLQDINQIIVLITTVKSGDYILLRVDEIDASKHKSSNK